LASEKNAASFDPKVFLAKVGEGTTILEYRKDQVVFSRRVTTANASDDNPVVSIESRSSFGNFRLPQRHMPLSREVRSPK
jgi:hypothetical protein